MIAKWMQRRRNEQSKPLSVRKTHMSKEKRSNPSCAHTTGSASNSLTPSSQVLGDRQTEVMELVQEIKQLKLERARIGCASCGVNSCCDVALSPQQPLPSPVRNLFFRTSLVAAVERISGMSNRECDAKAIAWETLIQEARRHIEEYKEWCEQHHSSNSCPMNRVPSMLSVGSDASV